MSKYMIIFTAIVIISYLAALFSKLYPINRQGSIGQPLPNPMGFIVPAVLFSAFSGLRRNLGDTDMYIYSYERMNPDTMEAVHFEFSGGTAYNVLQYYCRLKTDDPTLLIFITAVISCVPVIYIIYKYSCPYEVGIYLYVTTSYFSFSMNGIRQYMAASILLLASKYLFSEKKTDFLKYFAFVLIAWLLHESALIMIPIYFVVRRRAWSLFTIAMLIGTILATLLFDTFLPQFLGALEDTSYSQYAENGWFTSGNETGSNIIRVAVLVVPIALAYMQRKRLWDILGRKMDIMVNLSIINLMFYILSLYNWIFARLAIYTSIYAVILITWLIVYGFQREDGKKIYWGSVALYAVYFYFVRYSVDAYRSSHF